jgi:hypothetical protein
VGIRDFVRIQRGELRTLVSVRRSAAQAATRAGRSGRLRRSGPRCPPFVVHGHQLGAFLLGAEDRHLVARRERFV